MKIAHTVGKDLCEHIGKSNGFLLPVGALICHKCYKDLHETNPMPKKKKPEPPKPPEPRSEPKPKPKVKVFNRGDTLSSLTLRAPKEISSATYISPGSNSNPDSSEPGSSKSDINFLPNSQDVQDLRVKDLTGLLENNFKKERFKFRIDKDQTIDGLSRQQRNKQMKLLASGVESLINTISENKQDHINIYRRFVDRRYLDESLGNSISIDNFLRDVIEAYNKCVSDKHRIQVRQ